MNQGTGTLRKLLLGLLLLGMIGSSVELVLLEHTESAWQYLPIILLALGLALGLLVLVRPSRAAIRMLRLTMVTFLVGGVLGLYLHYRGNVEFELEMYPAIAGLELFWKAVTGATPALAPGMMVQLGLLGLLYCYRHPVVSESS